MKTFLKHTILLLLIFISSVSLYGQELWRNGVLITKDGTELKGKIKDEEWRESPTQIEFRQEGGDVKIFKDTEIKSFSTDRPVKYEYYFFEYDGDKQDTKNVQNLPYTREPTILTKGSQLLRVIVDSRISLLQFIDSNNRFHYFIKVDTTLSELLRREFRYSETFVSTNERYKQTLSLLSTECASLKNKFLYLKYDELPMEKIIVEINECKGNSIVPIWKGAASERRKPSLGIAFNPFLNSTKYEFATSGVGPLNFGGGLFYEIFSRKRPNRVSVYNELTYNSVSQSGNLSRDIFLYSSDISLSFSKIKMMHSLRSSKAFENGSRIFLGAGLSYGMRMGTQIHQNSIYQFELPNLEDGFEIGFVGSVGTSLAGKSFHPTIEFRFGIDRMPGSNYYLGSSNFGLSFQVPLR